MNRNRLFYYCAGPIESMKLDESGEPWKQALIKGLEAPNVYPYNPVTNESLKTGTTSDKTCQCIKGLKQSGHWKDFDAKLREIWWAGIDPGYNKFDILKDFQCRARENLITPEEFAMLGDFPAVASSSFITVYIPKDTKTVGSYAELTLAYFLNIPVYLILDGHTKSEANSTLLFLTRQSNNLGENNIFYNVQDAVKQIRQDFIDNRK